MRRAIAIILSLAFSSSAHAAVIFGFGGPNVDLGTTHTYTDSGGGTGLQVIATGYDNSNPANLIDLYGKNLGGTEVGLGLTNDPTGQHEIYLGKGFVQIDVNALINKVTNLQFSTNSLTSGEQWSVYGSNVAGSHGATALATGTTATSTALPSFGTYRYYDFAETSQMGGRNFLLAGLTATAVPEPATWMSMLIGLGMIGAFMRRRSPVKITTRNESLTNNHRA